MLLSLPVLAPTVPAIIEFSPASERHLRLVLAMSRLGMIADDDLEGLRQSRLAASSLKRLIETGWTRAIGSDFDFEFLAAQARLILPDSSDEEFLDETGQTQQIGVAFNGSTPEWIAIGKAFTAIEEAQAGLGGRALAILESALCEFSMPHTPSGAFELAQMNHWEGEDDESSVLAEYGEDSDVVRRADLFGDIPEWAYDRFNAKGDLPTVAAEDFAQHVERLATHPVGPLLAALLRLQELDNPSARYMPRQDEWGESNEPPVVTGWHRPDDFDQLFDQNYRYHCECGEEPPWVGCIKFAPSEAGISEALPVIRHTAAVLRALDRALVETRKLNDGL